MKKGSAYQKIDSKVLKELKKRAKAEGKPQTRVIKDYLASLQQEQK